MEMGGNGVGLGLGPVGHPYSNCRLTSQSEYHDDQTTTCSIGAYLNPAINIEQSLDCITCICGH